MQTRASRRCGNDRGAVIPIVALFLVVLMTMTAFTVDLGRQMMRRREAQAAADVVALDLGRLLDGRSEAAILADPVWSETLNASAVRNGFPVGGLSPQLGLYTRSTDVFVPCPCGATAPNGVRVTATDTVDYFFAPVIGISSGTVSRSAIAAQRARSEAELGSVFAGFQYYNEPGVSAAYNLAAEVRAGILNATLKQQFGIGASAPTGIGFDALGYKGLSNGTVTLGELATAAGFGSADEMLDSDISGADLLNAEATALRNSSDQNNVAAGNQMAQFAGTADTNSSMRLRNLIRVEEGGDNNVANYRVNALSLMTMGGQIINGKHFFQTTVNHRIPGVPPLPVRISIIEGPAVRDGEQGDPGPSTAQIRFATSIPITLDLGSFGTFDATVPLVAEAAKATSIFSRIQCGNPSTLTATDLRVLTNGLNLQIGSITDAALQNSQTLSVQASAILRGSIGGGLLPSVSLENATTVNVSRTFKGSATYTGDLASNVGVLGADETHTFLGQTAPIDPASWRYNGGVGNTNMSTTLFNAITLSGGVPGLEPALRTALTTQLGDLDNQFLDGMFSALGVAVAGADGAIHYANCGVNLFR